MSIAKSSSSILLLALTLSYIPQYNLSIHRRSTLGISPCYLLFNLLFATGQLANILLLSSYRFPVLSCVASGEIRGFEAFGVLLGLLQATVLWIGSILMMLLPASCSSSPKAPDTVRSLDSNFHRSSDSISRTIGAVSIIYTLLFLVPAAAIALPRPWEPSLGPDLFIGISAYVNIPASTAFIVIAIACQISTLRATQSSGSMSGLTLAAQALVLVLLGWSLQFRLQRGHSDRHTLQREGFATWYYSLGWPVVNFMLAGLGQAVLLAVVLYHRIDGNGSGPTANERTRLL